MNWNNTIKSLRIFPSSVYLITCIATVLSFLFIGKKSIWLDEALTVSIARNWNTMWYILLYREPYMWLYYVLFFIWTRLGTGEAYIRSLSAAFAIATVPIVFLLASRLFGKKVGVMACLMLVLNPLFIQYAQEVRAYSLLLLLTTLSSLLFTRAVLTQSKKYIFSYVLTSVAAIYAHHAAYVFILTHALSSIIFYRSKKQLRYIYTSVLLIFLGSIPLLIFQITHTNIGWISRPTVESIVTFFITLAGGHVLLLYLYALILGWTVYLFWRQLRTKIVTTYIWKAVYLLLLLFFPALLALTVSMTIQPIFVSRYLLPSLIPLVILGAFGITHIKTAPLRSGTIIVFIAFSATSLWVYYTENAPPVFGRFIHSKKENWRNATNYILSNSKSGDAGLFYAYFIRVPYEYYETTYDNVWTTPHLLELASSPYDNGGVLPEPNEQLLNTVNTRFPRVWLILSHNTSQQLMRDKQSEEIVNSLSNRYSQKTQKFFNGIQVLLFSNAIK